jgi:hypothetical protein
VVALTGWILARRGDRTIGLERRRGCHEVVEMRFEEGELRSKPVRVCPERDSGSRAGE